MTNPAEKPITDYPFIVATTTAPDTHGGIWFGFKTEKEATDYAGRIPCMECAIYAFAPTGELEPVTGFPEWVSRTERKIILKLIDDIIAAGHSISVNDGEETTLHRSRDRNAICREVAATEETFIHIMGRRPDSYGTASLGWVWLIHGNENDVISDYTDNATTNELVAGANDLANTF